MAAIVTIEKEIKVPFHKKMADRFMRRFGPLTARLLLWARKYRTKISDDLVVRIEQTNACNADCGFCPHGVMERKIGIMGYELFCKIVDDCGHAGITKINLTSFGESFIDKRFIDKIRYAKDKGIPYVYLTSNGSLLDEKRCRGIIESGLDEIRISLDTLTKEAFEKVRVGLKHETVISNIERLIELKKETGSKKPKITVNFVETPHNHIEVKPFIEMWKDKVDLIHIQGLHNWADRPDLGRSNGYVPCRRLWFTLNIQWDGTVALCCADYEGKVILGDMRSSSILDIWNNERFQWAREQNLKRADKFLCQGCNLPDRDSLLWVKQVLIQ